MKMMMMRRSWNPVQKRTEELWLNTEVIYLYPPLLVKVTKWELNQMSHRDTL